MIKVGFLLPLCGHVDRQIRIDCLSALSGFANCLAKIENCKIDCRFYEFEFDPDQAAVSDVLKHIQKQGVDALVTFGDGIGSAVLTAFSIPLEFETCWRVPIFNIAYSLDYTYSDSRSTKQFVAKPIRMWPSTRLMASFIADTYHYICQESHGELNPKIKFTTRAKDYNDRYKKALTSVGINVDGKNSGDDCIVLGYATEFYGKLKDTLLKMKDHGCVITENFLDSSVAEGLEGNCYYPGIHSILQLDSRSFDLSRSDKICSGICEYIRKNVLAIYTEPELQNDVFAVEKAISEHRGGVSWSLSICKYFGYATAELIQRGSQVLRKSKRYTSLFDYFKRTRCFSTILGNLIICDGGETMFPVSRRNTRGGEVVSGMLQQFGSGYLLEKVNDVLPQINNCSTKSASDINEEMLTHFFSDILGEIDLYADNISWMAVAKLAHTNEVRLYSDSNLSDSEKILLQHCAEFFNELHNSSLSDAVQLTESKFDIEDNDTLRIYNLEDGVAYAAISSVVNGTERLFVGKTAVSVEMGYDGVTVRELSCRCSEKYFEIGKFSDYIYAIPAVSNQKEDEAFDHSGYLLLHTKRKLTYLAVHVLLTVITRLYSDLFSRFFAARLESQSIQSAVAAIMSRNGSHNLGSHVLAALSHNVGTMPDDRVLYQYIQNRMDYMATVTTDFPKWTYTTKLVGGMVKEFLSQRHLLDYISRSEGLHAFRFQDHNNKGNGWANQRDTIRLHVSRLGIGVPGGDEVSFLEYPKGDQTREQLIASARSNLQYDLDVAIPGGVIGQHAFFTIIENIIRNAAKHGWATLPAEKRHGENDHLDVYVRFELQHDCRNILVRISDNISDVFYLPEAESEDNARKTALNICHSWVDANKNYLTSVLPIEDFKLIRSFLSGKGKQDASSLPAEYFDLYSQLSVVPNGGERPLGMEISELLTGAPDPSNPDTLGFRLWLPLHHKQQILLAEKFIGDDGSLRREHWGLAEMKISAGFLQMRSIEDIGGLNDKVNDYQWENEHALLIPCCGVGNHLEYQFRIRSPREVAFVLRQSEMNGHALSEETCTALQKKGVYVIVIKDGDVPGRDADIFYARVFTSGDKEELNWDYRYVVLPNFPNLKDPQLPFRILLGRSDDRDAVNEMSIICKDYQVVKGQILELDLAKPANASSIDSVAYGLKQKVYLRWNEYWTTHRRDDIKKEDKPIALCLNVFQGQSATQGSQKSGAERCLISDADVWETVLNELFRSYARRMISKNLDRTPQLHLKTYLAMLAVVDKRKSEHFDDSMPRVSMLKFMGKWMDEILCDANTTKEWIDSHLKELNEFLESCDSPRSKKFRVKFDLPSLQSSMIQFHEDIKKWIDTCDSDKSKQYGEPVSMGGMTYPGLSAAMTCLEDAFEYVNVMLRKYEERIVTLPESFKTTSRPSASDRKESDAAVGHAKEIGINLFLHGNVPVEPAVSLSYIRHYRPSSDDMTGKKYVEPLSGTQSYLNTLGRLENCNDVESRSMNQSALSSLYENALSRILIVDERTAEFVKKHAGAAEVFSRMGIWVYDHETWGCDVDAKGVHWRDGALPLTQTLLSEKEIGVELMLDGGLESVKPLFDVLIIHQGLIDKWRPAHAHNRVMVAQLLDNIKKYVPYVLITTGRGTPANTPNTARILPFSIIEKTLFRQSPEKLILMDTVMNVLPIGVRK